jgi:Mrp family chromosome partitioning ATPase/uncharacterized protein involved in exopolysaccharide biosynthesis
MSTEMQNGQQQGAIQPTRAQESGGELAPPAVNPLLLAHQLLRGRYIWAILLSLIGGATGAYFGFRSGQVTYRSRGQIRVAPLIQKIIYDNEASGSLPMYDAFMEHQIALIRSQRVLGDALQDEKWKALGRDTGNADQTLLTFMRTLGVSRAGEFICIDVVDRDPKAAMISVKAVVEAYWRLYSEDDNESGKRRQEILQARETELTTTVANIRDRILTIAKENGSDDLSDLCKFKLVQLNKLEASVQELQAILAGLSAAATQPATTQPEKKGDGPALAAVVPTTQPIKGLTPDQVAAADARMRQFLDEKWQVQRSIDDMEVRRLAPEHPDMVRANRKLAALDSQIKKYVADYEAGHPVASPTTSPSDGGPTTRPATDVVALRQRLNDLELMRVRQKEELLALGRQDLTMRDLREQATDVKQRLVETRKRMEELRVEGNSAARVSVFSSGDRPLEPFQDDRVKLAGTGGAGGALAGVGLVVLIGFVDRRLRYVDDARFKIQSSPMLGMLPELPRDLADPEYAAIAAHAVHQIRGLLQIWGGARNHRVFSITSPISGTGKTSLTLALGVSFAAAKSRTLLIDGDLVGGGLTYQSKAVLRRKIGHILEKDGVISRRQLEEALLLAGRSDKPVGQVLVESGAITETQLAEALTRQDGQTVGILDAILGEDLDECVLQTATPGLSILPLGGATAEHAGQLSPVALRSVIQQARERYDTILIDTGPTPGSLEAAVAASEADGVVLVVSRGERRHLVEQCVQHLLSVGAHVAGFVFNRAKTDDMVEAYRTTIRMSVRERTDGAPDGATDANANSPTASSGFGPVADAVAPSGRAAR